MSLSVYNIPAGIPFASSLAKGIISKHGGLNGWDLGKVRLFVPSRRGIRALQDAFLQENDGRMMILPRIYAVGDTPDEMSSALISESPLLNTKPPISTIARQFLLTRQLCESADCFSPTTGEAFRYDEGLSYALELAGLLDSLYSERIPPERISELDMGDFSTHWQENLNLLQIALTQWPQVLKEKGFQDKAEYRNSLLDNLTTSWKENPPPFPVYVVGSTGSMPATADLMKVVSTFPDGGIVLPGLDMALDAVSEKNILEHKRADHPQYGLYSLLKHFGITKEDVKLWPWAEEFETDKAKARRIFFSEIMRPSETTEDWKTLHDRLPSSLMNKALEDFHLIEAETDRSEAQIIALIMKQHLETSGKTIALMTPDRKLAGRVKSALLRWGLIPDDSGGIPLCDTSRGLFTRLLIEMMESNFSPVSLLCFMKNPLFYLGYSATDIRYLVTKFEKIVLRGKTTFKGLSDIRSILDTFSLENLERKDEGEDYVNTITRLKEFFQRFKIAFTPLFKENLENAPLEVYTLALVEVINNLTRNAEETELNLPLDVPEGSLFWLEESGIALKKLLEHFSVASVHLSPLPQKQALHHISRFMTKEMVRPHAKIHPRLFIWGTPEARLQQADILILGGLNEEVWPIRTETGVWLSRTMREQLGLSPLERRVGLSAHDFVQAGSSSKVYITRSKRIDGRPQVASRWILRLQTMLTGAYGESLESISNTPLPVYAHHIDRPDTVSACSAPLPCPAPELRPQKLSITQISTWRQDPYHIYAKHVLGLYPLLPVAESLNVAQQGTLLHKIMERFILETQNNCHRDRLENVLDTIITEETAFLENDPLLLHFWKPSIDRLRKHLIEWEIQEQLTKKRKPLFIEQRGEIMLETPDKHFFKLSGKMDRIDVTPDNTFIVTDYKTGEPSSWPHVKRGLDPQLLLGAWMQSCGAFHKGDMPAVSLKYDDIQYIRLKGRGKDSFDVRSWNKGAKKPLEEAVLSTVDGLKIWIDTFMNSETPYVSWRMLPWNKSETTIKNHDYDHLARIGEWYQSAEEEDA